MVYIINVEVSRLGVRWVSREEGLHKVVVSKNFLRRFSQTALQGLQAYIYPTVCAESRVPPRIWPQLLFREAAASRRFYSTLFIVF